MKKILKNPQTYILLLTLFLTTTDFDLDLYKSWSGLITALKMFFSNPALIIAFLYAIYNNFYSKGVGE